MSKTPEYDEPAAQSARAQEFKAFQHEVAAASREWQQVPLAAPDPHSREVYREFLARQQPVVTRSKKHGLEPGKDRGMGR